MTAALTGLLVALSTRVVLSAADSPADTLRELLAAAPLPRDLAQLAVEYRGIPRPSSVVNDLPPRYSAGQQQAFWIGQQHPPAHFQVEAELQFVGRHAYWYVQRGYAVAPDALRESAAAFDTRIYPEVRRIVGSESFPGIDNDPRITVFNGDIPGVAGYVSSSDSYPTSVHPHSNQREIIYLNVRAHEVGSSEYLTTLAHEFTHLVHWNVNSREETWIKEGLAQLVSHLVFPQTALPSGAMRSTPDVQLTAWSDVDGPSVTGAHYQTASWFLRYLQDRFGDATLTGIVSREGSGVASIERFLRDARQQSSFEALFGDWAAANAVGLQDGPSGYRNQGPQRPQARKLRPDDRLDESVAQFGTRYYEVVPAGGVTVEFEGATTVSTLAADPYAGNGMWYAGRADASTATMTRAFDLPADRPATLAFWIWHDIEFQYDFAHVSVSTDGGHRWQLVEGSGMSRANSTGNNLGVGYTGRSGEGSTSQWIEQHVDLTRYAGQRVLVRFSYLTDDAILREGVALDEIRIDALGFRDGAEDPQTGWARQGWSRVGRSLPQSWSIRAIEFTDGIARVVDVPVDASGRARWTASAGGVERLVLAIAGTTPATVQRGQFRLTVTR